MPRGQFFGHREAQPDSKYRDKLVGKFLNVLMGGGKKSTAERICYGAFDLIQEKTNGGDPMKIFKSAIDNVKPVVEVKSRRVGGASYQVPVEIRPSRRVSRPPGSGEERDEYVRNDDETGTTGKGCHADAGSSRDIAAGGRATVTVLGVFVFGSGTAVV